MLKHYLPKYNHCWSLQFPSISSQKARSEQTPSLFCRPGFKCHNGHSEMRTLFFISKGEADISPPHPMHLSAALLPARHCCRRRQDPAGTRAGELTYGDARPQSGFPFSRVCSQARSPCGCTSVRAATSSDVLAAPARRWGKVTHEGDRG